VQSMHGAAASDHRRRAGGSPVVPMADAASDALQQVPFRRGRQLHYALWLKRSATEQVDEVPVIGPAGVLQSARSWAGNGRADRARRRRACQAMGFALSVNFKMSHVSVGLPLTRPSPNEYLVQYAPILFSQIMTK